MRKRTSLILILFLCTPLITFGQHSLKGNWKGYINIMGNHLTIKTHFKRADDKLTGTIDIPQQGANGLNLEKISPIQKDSVSFGFSAGPGYASFTGTFSNDSTISGTFTQRGQHFPFKLTQSAQAETKITSQKQTEQPFNQRDLIIKRNNSVEIGGTLTWPKNQPTNQLVIIISGSGAQNRDGGMPITDFKPYMALASSLTKNGFATFRYDDRGIGKSTGNFSQASLDSLSSDVEAIIHHFSKTSTDHHFSKIILLGHSQGGIVAGKVAAEDSKVDKLILMSSPAEPLSNIVLEQVKVLNQEQNIPDSVIAQNVAIQRAIFDTLRGSQKFSQLEDTLVKYDTLGHSKQLTAQTAHAKVHQHLKTMESPFYFSFIDYDPTQDLGQLHIPVLVLFGEKDTQVLVKSNKPKADQALQKAGTNYKIHTFPNANHLYQKAKTGAISEYSELPSKFVDGLITTIVEWIQNTK